MSAVGVPIHSSPISSLPAAYERRIQGLEHDIAAIHTECVQTRGTLSDGLEASGQDLKTLREQVTSIQDQVRNIYTEHSDKLNKLDIKMDKVINTNAAISKELQGLRSLLEGLKEPSFK
ncbi:hypothetical protein FRC12_003107 [Ceratobasidium sp. 428]|nr:hypothetical protein FRC09_005316 [Ceratobasidium sp. 395]KAG8793316.1 hypothetical protein FRC12_003107 [Ceratobasidium sp. 428]